MPNNVSNVGFFGPQALGAALAPDAYSQGLQAQQQQAMAQQLMGSGMTPLDPNRSSGRFATRINPLEGFAKMAQTFMGTKLQQNANAQQAASARAMGQALLQAANGGTPQPQAPQQTAAAGGGMSPAGMSPNTSQMAFGSPDYASQPQAQPAPQSGGGQPNYLQLSAIQSLYGQEAAKVAAASMTPTDLEKTMMAAGIDPRSPQGKAFLEANLKKQNYIAPPVVRQNSVALDPNTNQPMFANPAAAPGTTNVWQPGNPYPVRNERVPGSLENIQAEAQTTAFGKGAGAFPFSEQTNAAGARVPAFTIPNLQAPSSPNQPAPAAQTQPAQPRQQASPKPASNDPWATMPKLSVPQGIGQSTYEGKLAERNAEHAFELSKTYGAKADAANERKVRNDQAMSLIDKADTGPGAAMIADVKNVLVSRFGIPEDDFKNTPSATTALQKDLVNSAVQQAKKYFGGRISTAEVMLMLSKGSPNVDMPKAAMKYLLQTDNATADYEIKQAGDLGKYLSSGGDPLRFEGWYTRTFPMTKEVGHVQMGGGEQRQDASNVQAIVDELRRRGAVK